MRRGITRALSPSRQRHHEETFRTECSLASIQLRMPHPTPMAKPKMSWRRRQRVSVFRVEAPARQDNQAIASNGPATHALLAKWNFEETIAGQLVPSPKTRHKKKT